MKFNGWLITALILGAIWGWLVMGVVNTCFEGNYWALGLGIVVAVGGAIGGGYGVASVEIRVKRMSRSKKGRSFTNGY